MDPAPGTGHPAQLIEFFRAGIDAVHPHRLFQRETLLMELRRASRNTERIAVVGAGKAAIPMAACLEEALGEDLDEGLVVVPRGYSENLPHGIRMPKRVRVMESDHPVPSREGSQAGERIIELVRDYHAEDLVVVVISGGASSLLPTTMPGISIEDLQAATGLLLRSGASIHEINTVRKHISAIGGGRLAQVAYPTRIMCYLISDVTGDDPSSIGSGPCVPDETTLRDARDVLYRYELWDRLPKTVADHLRSGAFDANRETPDSESGYFDYTTTRVIGSNGDAVKAAWKAASDAGLSAVVVESPMSGEARKAGIRLARGIADAEPGTCIIWGGETTVTVRGDGVGGRNQELVLAAALELERLGSDATILSAGTDGIDGMTGAAGAWADGSTASRAREAGRDPEAALERNDSGTFFEALGQQIVTGPTHTNVMDVAIAVGAG